MENVISKCAYLQSEQGLEDLPHRGVCNGRKDRRRRVVHHSAADPVDHETCFVQGVGGFGLYNRIDQKISQWVERRSTCLIAAWRALSLANSRVPFEEEKNGRYKNVASANIEKNNSHACAIVVTASI